MHGLWESMTHCYEPLWYLIWTWPVSSDKTWGRNVKAPVQQHCWSVSWRRHWIGRFLRGIPHASSLFFLGSFSQSIANWLVAFFGGEKLWKGKIHWVDVSWWFPSDFPIRFGIADALPACMMPRPRERKRWMQTTTSWHLYWGWMRWDFDPGWGTAAV